MALPFVDKSDFILEYVKVASSDDYKIIADWLINNGKKIDKNIFDSRNWDSLDILDVLVLRVFSPSEIFIFSNIEKYESAVGDSPLLALEECLFQNDHDFIFNLPSDLKLYSAQLEVLMDLAYKAKIRKS